MKKRVIWPFLALLLVLLLVFLYQVIKKPGKPSEPGQVPAKADTAPAEQLNNVSDSLGAINVYFNKSALTRYALPGNRSNFHVNLENRLLNRIRQAEHTIDVALYEINLPRIIDALLEKAAAGVKVRVIADAKDVADTHYVERYRIMRIYLEKLVRGKDNVIGTGDEVNLFSDSPICAVPDPGFRTRHRLPPLPADLDSVAFRIGRKKILKGRLLAQDEKKKNRDAWYAPQQQMHNKFLIIDSAWVWTGSWNYTITGLYGTAENMAQGLLGGNQQHCASIHSPALAGIYTTEFNEMWGSNNSAPDPVNSDFHRRKKDNTPHRVTVGNRLVEVYFSPGDRAVDRLSRLVAEEAERRVYFTIFAWSYQDLVNALKIKWEGTDEDFAGTLTGFEVKGVFDRTFWDMWWSASVEMTGRTASRTSVNNPNIRWYNPAPVFPCRETRKLHSKTMVIDGGTGSDPTVVMGSTNWSINGQDINDENLLIIHDRLIANQFVQEFWARYRQAGGNTP